MKKLTFIYTLFFTINCIESVESKTRLSDAISSFIHFSPKIHMPSHWKKDTDTLQRGTAVETDTCLNVETNLAAPSTICTSPDTETKRKSLDMI